MDLTGEMLVALEYEYHKLLDKTAEDMLAMREKYKKIKGMDNQEFTALDDFQIKYDHYFVGNKLTNEERVKYIIYEDEYIEVVTILNPDNYSLSNPIEDIKNDEPLINEVIDEVLYKYRRANTLYEKYISKGERPLYLR